MLVLTGIASAAEGGAGPLAPDLLQAVGLPFYLLLRANGVLCHEPIAPATMKALLYAEFATAAALIAMLGSTVLWLFWPIFCCAIVPFAQMPQTAINTILAVGAICNLLSPTAAFGLGALAGTVCVIGYVLIQPALQARFKFVDSCGVHNLHGMPGLLGGLTAILVVPGIATAQLTGIIVTVVLALGGGLLAGCLIKATGAKRLAYEDHDEFGETVAD